MHTKNHASSNSNSGNAQQSGALLVRLQQAFLALSILSSSAHAEGPKPPRIISDGQSHTQILGSNESPKRVIVLPGGSNTDVKNGLVVTSSVSKTPSPSATLQATKESGQEIILSNGDIISFIDLMKIGEKDPKREKEILAQIPEENRRLVKSKYNEWKIGNKKNTEEGLDIAVNQLDTGIASRRQEVNQKGLESAGLDQEVNQLNIQLIRKTEEYIALAEQGKLVPDINYIKENIINNPLFDKNLKARAKRFL